MTFPSRRKRRITAWSTAILISLGGHAWAQTPKADAPAPTSWSPYTPPAATPTPPVPVPTTSTPPKVEVPNLPPLPDPIQLPKMATPPKPTNETKPKPREAVPSQPSRAPAVQPIPVPVPVPAQPVSTPPAVIEAKPAMMTRPQTMNPPPVPQPTPQSFSPSSSLPDRKDLFRLDSDEALNARIIKELDKGADRFPVPASLSPPNVKYEPKTLSYSPSVLLREPNYVIHRRLYFEEKNAERAGWDAGPAQAVFSSLYFYRDALLFPGKFASGCKTPYDSSAGKCMPGDPTPYYCYPPTDITLFGGFVEGAVITGFAIILP